MKRTLILVPSPKIAGGVSNYYTVLKPYLNNSFTYMVRGRRFTLKYFDKFVLLLCYLYDIIHLLVIIHRYDILLINNSLAKEAFIRDAVYIQISKIFNKKVIVFFRGLDPKIQEEIESNKLPVFKKYILKADACVVLSKAFKNRLRKWGYKDNIFMETTIVDPNLVSLRTPYSNNSNNLLFLSRVEKYKGVYELLDSFIILQRNNNNLTLTIAGNGVALNELKKTVKDKSIENVFFPGYVEGKEKADIMNKADVFVFPSYAEGMPNAILEALAFGLPIVTSNVGGIPDIFVNEKMGFMIDDISPSNIAKQVKELIGNKTLCENISAYNIENSTKFLAPNVAKRLTKLIYNE